MNIVVIGGSGLIGKKLVSIFREHGHEAVAASPSSGVNTLTGEGLPQVLAGADIVVDVTNSPSFADAAVLEFFSTSTRNLLAAETAAGVGHHVALSVVGADRLPDSGYMRAKVAQEELIRASKVPHTIVRATQFFEFLGAIAQSTTVGDTATVPSAYFQPIASDDVAEIMADVAPVSYTHLDVYKRRRHRRARRRWRHHPPAVRPNAALGRRRRGRRAGRRGRERTSERDHRAGWSRGTPHRHIRGTFPGREWRHPDGRRRLAGPILRHETGRARPETRKQPTARLDILRRMDRSHRTKGVNRRPAWQGPSTSTSENPSRRRETPCTRWSDTRLRRAGRTLPGIPSKPTPSWL